MKNKKSLGLKEQVAILKSKNTKLVKHITKIDKQHKEFMRITMPKTFEYMHATYGQNDKFSPQTYAQMAMNIIKFKTLKFEE